MSDEADEEPLDASRLRKERVHSTMLIELLVLLIFLAISYAVVVKDNSTTSALEQQLEKAKADLAKAQDDHRQLTAENTALRQANAELGQSLARLLKTPPLSLPANADAVTMPNDMFKKAAKFLGLTQGHGGADLPNCPLTGGFLVSVDLMGSGDFATHPLWPADARQAAEAVPGLQQLTSGRSLTRGDFERLAGGVANWGKAQTPPCGFRAEVTEHHSDLALYKSQLRTVQWYFYVRAN